jgi:predicted dehydrogenase
MRLGVIGFGRRIRAIVKEITRQEPEARLAAIVDPQQARIADEWKEGSLDAVEFFQTPEAMVKDGQLDAILIGTRCSLHAEMALRVCTSGLPLFLEKPVATRYDDLHRLWKRYQLSKANVVVSFPLRLTPLVQLVKEIVDSGRIGTVEHVQAVNNVPYGSVYYQNWYRDEEETGGLFLQKATHDFDYLNYILGLQPVMISAMTSKQIYKGDKPSGLQCVDCEERNQCPESAVLKRKNGDIPRGEYCAFASDTGNEDSGSAMIRYETGMHAVYSQNFFARNSAARRGARFLGYKGTVEFDFYTNHVQVFMHQTRRTEKYDLHMTDDQHGGGDTALAQNFIDVIKGRSDSASPLESGIMSALMCLKAKDSARTNTFQSISLTVLPEGGLL